MNKLVLALALVAVAGCRPTSLRARVKALHARLPRAQIQIDPAALATATALVAAQQQARAQQAPPPSPAPSPSPSPRHQPAPHVEPQITRHTAPPPTFVLRGQTMGGAKICTKFTSMDECNADCTRQIREGAQLALTKRAGLTQNCVCVEGNGC